MILLLSFGCHTAATPSDTVLEPSSLLEARALVGLDRDAVLERVGDLVKPSQLFAYSSIQVPAPLNADIQLEEGKVVIVRLDAGFTNETTLVSQLQPEQLAAAYPDTVSLRSRAGKHFNHEVDASAGIAWAEGDRKVAYVELFEPTDLESYKRRFYSEPGPFYK